MNILMNEKNPCYDEKYITAATMFCSLLTYYKIPFTFNYMYDGFQWKFNNGGDVIIHKYSYNSENGYVESYGFPWDEGDVTSLPPREMARRIAGEEWNEREEYKPNIHDLIKAFDIFEEED